MTIEKETADQLVLKEPKQVSRMIGIMCIVMGGIATLGLLFETPFYMAGIPFMIVVVGVVIIKSWGKPDRAVFDKGAGELRVEKTGDFGVKAESGTYPLSQIVAVRLDRRKASGSGRSRKVYAIIVTIDDVGKIPLCPHFNRREYRKEAADRARSFLGLEGPSAGWSE